MRVVLDTNVVVSSLWSGPPSGILAACREGRVRVLVSLPILEEYFAVLTRFEVTDEDMDLFGSLFTDPSRTEICSPTVRVRRIREDPSDDKFLECAVAGGADFIVSGDKHLLKLGSFRGIPILTSRTFLSKI